MRVFLVTFQCLFKAVEAPKMVILGGVIGPINLSGSLILNPNNVKTRMHVTAAE